MWVGRDTVALAPGVTGKRGVETFCVPRSHSRAPACLDTPSAACLDAAQTAQPPQVLTCPCGPGPSSCCLGGGTWAVHLSTSLSLPPSLGCLQDLMLVSKRASPSESSSLGAPEPHHPLLYGGANTP